MVSVKKRYFIIYVKNSFPKGQSRRLLLLRCMEFKSYKELREIEYQYCREHLEYFVRKYGHIEDKDADTLIQPFDLWPEQEKALGQFRDHKLNVILKARQLGITWLVLHYALWKMINPGRTVIGLSRTEDEAQELVRRMAVILDNMRSLFAPKNDQPVNWANAYWENTSLILTIHFANGPDSVFKCFPSSPNAARSFTADLIVFDEWAFQQFAEDIWKAGFPTINRPNGGQVVGLSTIERGSFFEKVFTDPDNGFNKIFIPWYADPRRDEKWYEQTKRTMGDMITQEYPATIDEALTVPGGSFFPEVKRETHITNVELEGKLRRYVCLDYGLDMLSAHWIQVDTKGNAQIYREYDAPDKTIGAACDILRSLSGDERIEYWLAPSDLWSRSQETGKSRAILFSENGINLTKTSRDFPAGCASMKEWLKPIDDKARLTILEGCAPNLYRCLQKIQKDKKRPNIYAKDPHDLTHDVDSLRSFCVWWVRSPEIDYEVIETKQHQSILEDIENASPEDREYLLKKYGEPA